jgi:hypothetical protein
VMTASAANLITAEKGAEQYQRRLDEATTDELLRLYRAEKRALPRMPLRQQQQPGTNDGGDGGGASGAEGRAVQTASQEEYDAYLRGALQEHRTQCFSTIRHLQYGAPMTLLQLLVGVPILYAELQFTGML